MHAHAVLCQLSGSSSGKGFSCEKSDNHSMRAVLLLVKDAALDIQVA